MAKMRYRFLLSTARTLCKPGLRFIHYRKFWPARYCVVVRVGPASSVYHAAFDGLPARPHDVYPDRRCLNQQPFLLYSPSRGHTEVDCRILALSGCLKIFRFLIKFLSETLDMSNKCDGDGGGRTEMPSACETDRETAEIG